MFHVLFWFVFREWMLVFCLPIRFYLCNKIAKHYLTETMIPYLPLHNVPEKKYLLKISGKVCFYAVAVPLYAFISCVIITMYKDFENANKTHCNVPNLFPSISASIGNYEPQSTLWKTAIYFHAPVRFTMISLRYKYYKKVIREDFDVIVKVAVFLNVVENFTLLGLTHWTSSQNYCEYLSYLHKINLYT